MINISKIIMVVLGCHLPDIQNDRILTAIEYSKNLTNLPIWFLTGGIKNDLDTCQDTMSEASTMLSILNKTDNIILDEKAKNTAENFYNLKLWINNNNITNYDIVITTSEFHKIRAEKIFNGIFKNNIKAKWNLSKKSCFSCWNDEKIHMKNIDNDIKILYEKIEK
jgi:uncharacterized SAM-binding protein YcdF (DUF218 family)